MPLLERRFDEPIPEAEDRFGVDLAHPRFGDVEHRADLGQGEPLEVVQRHDQPVPLGQAIDRVGEEIAGLFSFERSAGIERCDIGHDVTNCG